MSADERITGRPVAPRVPEFDEDAPPRPLAGVAVDLSGNYRDDPWGWLVYGAGKWGRLFGPFLGFVAFVSFYGVGCHVLFLLFLRAPLACAAFLVALQVVRGGTVSNPLADQWFRCTGRLLVSTLLHLLLLAFAIAGFVALLLLAHGVGLRRISPELYYGMGISALLLLGAVGYLYLRFSFANALIVDQQMTVLKAFAASWQLTRGHELALAAFYLHLGLLFLVGLLAFGVGLFFTVPLISLAEASLYLHATGQVDGRQFGKDRLTE
jgi:hypothetical protein